MSNRVKIIEAQPGFQSDFLSSSADIVIGGGSAGAGKTFALLLEYARHINVEGWNGVIFRRTSKQITATGGMWQKASDLFLSLPVGSRPKLNETHLTLRFPSSAQLQFSHLQHEKDKHNWQGAALGFIGFDELTHFTESQFFYLITRNRSVTGVKPYVRATCNPQGQGWVKDFLQWFIYPDDYQDEALAMYPIPERAGKLRYFTRFRNTFYQADSAAGVIEQLSGEAREMINESDVKSFTFIPGSLSDNQELLKQDPGYKANLLAQEAELVEQLFKGRWITIADEMMRLFDYGALRDMFTNNYVRHGKRYITADIAHEGSDLFIIMVWSGWRVIKVFSHKKILGDGVLREIKRVAQQYAVPRSNICFDADSIGNYLKGFLRTAIAFNGNASPVDVGRKKQSYKNFRTQCMYILRDVINDYELFIDHDEVGGKVADRIISELWATKKAERGIDGKLRIVSKSEIKAELGFSPDYGDALMMRVAFKLLARGRRRAGAR